MEPKPGASTSEFKLTTLLVFIGALLDGAGIVLESLRDSGTVSATWLPVALVVVGTALMLFKALGYTRSRTMLKLAERQPALTEVLKVDAPFVQDLVAVLRSELAKPETTAQPSP